MQLAKCFIVMQTVIASDIISLFIGNFGFSPRLLYLSNFLICYFQGLIFILFLSLCSRTSVFGYVFQCHVIKKHKIILRAQMFKKPKIHPEIAMTFMAGQIFADPVTTIYQQIIRIERFYTDKIYTINFLYRLLLSHHHSSFFAKEGLFSYLVNFVYFTQTKSTQLISSHQQNQITNGIKILQKGLIIEFNKIYIIF